MKIKLKQVAAVAASAALVSGGMAIVGAQSASAAVLTTYLGNLGISQTGGLTGTTSDNFSVTTTAGCPADDGAGNNTRNFRVTMNGPGWNNQVIVGNTSSGVSTTGPMSFPLSDNLAGIAQANGLPAPSGTYLITGFCQNAAGTATSGRFYSQWTFTGSTFTRTAIPEETTTTGLVVAKTSAPATPVSSALTTDNLTLTATVGKTGTAATLAGSVQFKVGATNLGTPVAINGSGVATTTTTFAAVGSRSITAVFVADNTANVIPNAQVLGSTSPASVISIVAPATTTTTTVSSPAQVFVPNPILVVATVTAGDNVNGSFPAGTVAFSQDGSPIAGCGSQPVSAGSVSLTGTATCSLPSDAPERNTTFTAVFTPTSAAAFVGSTNSGQTSGNVTAIKTQAATRVATEFITTTIDAGALTLTVQGFATVAPNTPSPGTPTGTPVNAPSYPYGVYGNVDANGKSLADGSNVGTATGATNVVILPKAALNPAGTLIVTKGNIIPVVATDTRVGDLPYSVTGKLLGNFKGVTPTNEINAANLGWTPIFIKSSRFPAQGPIAAGATATLGTDTNGANVNLTAGALVAPANGLAPTVTSTAGLASDQTLFSINKGAGTIFYGAELNLQAPTTTQADTYTATLQLTAVGSGV